MSLKEINKIINVPKKLKNINRDIDRYNNRDIDRYNNRDIDRNINKNIIRDIDKNIDIDKNRDIDRNIDIIQDEINIRLKDIKYFDKINNDIYDNINIVEI